MIKSHLGKAPALFFGLMFTFTSSVTVAQSATDGIRPTGGHNGTVILDIAEFVDLVITQSFAALQYNQQNDSQALSLKAIENRHLPGNPPDK